MSKLSRKMKRAATRYRPNKVLNALSDGVVSGFIPTADLSETEIDKIVEVCEYLVIDITPFRHRIEATGRVVEGFHTTPTGITPDLIREQWERFNNDDS